MNFYSWWSSARFGDATDIRRHDVTLDLTDIPCGDGAADVHAYAVRCIVHEACRADADVGVACANQMIEVVKTGYSLPLVRRSFEGDLHNPCMQCVEDKQLLRENGSILSCCPKQWQEEHYVCSTCGYKAHRLGLYNLEKLGPSHLRGADGTGREHWCGPMVPDPETPGFWRCWGRQSLYSARYTQFERRKR